MVGERSSGWEERRFKAKRVPAEWETMEMWEMWRWVRSRGMVSWKTGILWLRGTEVEAPNPGLGLLALRRKERDERGCLRCVTCN